MSQPPLNVDISIGTRLFRQSPNDVFLATFVSQPWMSCVALEATSHTKGMPHTALLRISSFSHGPRSFQLVWLSRLIPGSSVIRFVLQWSSGMLGAYSCHCCFLPLLERIAWEFCGGMWQFRPTTASLQELETYTNGLATYMFASCSASVHYGNTQKGWQPTCLQAAVLQFTTASRKTVGDLHVCKLQCFSSLRHHAKGLATYLFGSCSASVHYVSLRKGW